MPIVVHNKVVVVAAISVGVVNPTSLDFCHFNTAPVLPIKVRSAGEVPKQIGRTAVIVPPKVVGLTLKVTDRLNGFVQFGIAFVVVMPVISNVCPLLT